MSIGLLSPFTHSLLMSLVWTLCVLASQYFPITRAVSRAMWEMEKIGLCGALKKIQVSWPSLLIGITGLNFKQCWNFPLCYNA